MTTSAAVLATLVVLCAAPATGTIPPPPQPHDHATSGLPLDLASELATLPDLGPVDEVAFEPVEPRIRAEGHARRTYGLIGPIRAGLRVGLERWKSQERPGLEADSNGIRIGSRKRGHFRDDTEDSDGYGLNNPQHQSLVNRNTFTGKYYDRGTGLFYFHARYYDPDTGRFISQDGFDYGDINNPPSLHLYYYALNNPLRYTDPDGHETRAAEELQALRGEIFERSQSDEGFRAFLAQRRERGAKKIGALGKSELNALLTVPNEALVVGEGRGISAKLTPAKDDLSTILSRIQRAADDAARDFGLKTSEDVGRRGDLGKPVDQQLQAYLDEGGKYSDPRVLTEVEVDAEGRIVNFGARGRAAEGSVVKDVVVLREGLSEQDIALGKTKASDVTEVVLDLKTGGRGANMRTRRTMELFGSTPLELRPHGNVMEQQARRVKGLRRVRVGSKLVKGTVLGAVALGVLEGGRAFAAGDPEAAIKAVSVTGDVEFAAQAAGAAASSQVQKYLGALGATGAQRTRQLQLEEEDRR